MAEFRDPSLVKVRSVNHPQNHFEPVVACGDKQYVHDDDGCIWVPRDHAAALLKRGGYLVVSE